MGRNKKELFSLEMKFDPDRGSEKKKFKIAKKFDSMNGYTLWIYSNT